MARPEQVDSAVPRGKAAFHALLPAAAFLLDTVAAPAGKYVVGFTAVAMTLSVLGGPQWSLFGITFNKLIRPTFKIRPGTRESAAPHRFAETLGAAFLLAATVAFLLGVAPLGWGLALLVAALAAVNWLAGICVGCQMYVLMRRLGHRASV